MMVQENSIELEKMTAWSTFLFRRLRVTFSGEVWIWFNSYSIKVCF